MRPSFPDLLALPFRLRLLLLRIELLLREPTLLRRREDEFPMKRRLRWPAAIAEFLITRGQSELLPGMIKLG